MSTLSTEAQVTRHPRASRRRKEALDLNVPPRVENLEQAGGPAVYPVQVGPGDFPAISVDPGVQVHRASGSVQPTPIDVEELDDDVIISSPRAFEEAKKKSRRPRRTVVVDVESVESEEDAIWLNQANKRRRGQTNLPIINCELYVNLEGSSGSMRGTPHYVALPQPPPPPPPPPEPAFTCPVCIGPLVEEVTTRCGHIFCKGCIKAAISAQHKCPTCRRKISNRDIIRVYLPTTK